MNLLEKAKKIIEYDEHNHYKNLKDTDIGKFSPQICRALVDAMEEIEDMREKIRKNNPCFPFPSFEMGIIDDCLLILRKHLEVEK